MKADCWVVGDHDGGHVTWDAAEATNGLAEGWTVIPLVRLDRLAADRKAQRVAGFMEAIRVLQEEGGLRFEIADRIEAGDDHV